jgi:methylmalonyl-CoA mutase N-terminal domain/subunit
MSEDGSMTSGILRGIEDGWFMAEIAEASFTYPAAAGEGREEGRRGPTCTPRTAEQPIEILRSAIRWSATRPRALARRRADRDDAGARAAIAALREAAAATAT